MPSKSRNRGRKGGRGHPSRTPRHIKRRRDAQQLRRDHAVNELLGNMRSEAMANEGEGILASVLGSAARWAAPHIAGAHGLDGDEHRAGVAVYLTNRLSDAVDGFDRDEYLAWRADCAAGQSST